MQTLGRVRAVTELDTTAMLSIDQQRALTSLMTQLDLAHGVPGPHMVSMFGLARDIEEVLRVATPDGPRKPRTPEHRKVLSAYVDGGSLPSYLRPWQYLVFQLLETLLDAALASEKPAMTALRTELLNLTRLQEDADRAPNNTAASEVLARATTAFVKRFRAALPGLILNTVSLANSVLLYVIDNAHEASPDDAAQLLEASRYFLAAPSCAVALCGNEAVLVERLSRSGQGADGRGLLRGWQSVRIDIGGATPARAVAPVARAPEPRAATAVASSRPPRPRAQPSLASSASEGKLGVWLPMGVMGVTLALDQLTKVGAAGLPRTGILAGITLGVELLGIALAALLWMWAPEAARARRFGFALIAGGLGSSLIDAVFRGVALVPLRLGGLPGFSLAHVAMLSGIVILGIGLLRDQAGSP